MKIAGQTMKKQGTQPRTKKKCKKNANLIPGIWRSPQVDLEEPPMRGAGNMHTKCVLLYNYIYNL